MSGFLVGCQPYLRKLPSLNSDLFRLKFFLLSGNALSQLEALFSGARLVAFLSVSFRALMRLVFFRFILSVFNFLILYKFFLVVEIQYY